jgi:hypothetical protein
MDIQIVALAGELEFANAKPCSPKARETFSHQDFLTVRTNWGGKTVFACNITASQY